MREIVERTTLAAGAAAVWSFITDPERFPEYVDGYAHGTVRSPHPVGLGARYEWYGQLGPVKLRSIEEIVEWTEDSCVRYAGSMAGVPFWSAMQIAAAGEATDLTVSIRVRVPAWLGGGVSERLIVEPLVRSSVRRSLGRLTRRFGWRPHIRRVQPA